MPRTTPEEREGDFVAPENAQEKGYWGSEVKEFPREMHTVAGVVERRPGGPVGVEPGEWEDSVARQVPKIDGGGTDESKELRKEDDAAREKRKNLGPGTVRAEDDPAQSPRRERLGK